VTLELVTGALPLFPGALDLARAGHCSGGAKRGRAALAEEVELVGALEEALVNLVFDAETSGGLLICVPAEREAALRAELERRQLPVVRVGTVLAPRGRAIRLL
jgi:selenide,water dikinase